MNLLSTNDKLKKSGIFSFGIPALKTCPMADACKTGCYATMGRYAMPNVKQAQERRLEATRCPGFVDNMDREIKKRKVKRLRIHDSGDFYNDTYLLKWMALAFRNPDVDFYAYSKRVSMIKSWMRAEGDNWPGNLTIIFSYGGREDHLIDRDKDRHSIVFSKEVPFDYIDASHDDTLALTDNKKIGLVYHGYKSRTWGK